MLEQLKDFVRDREVGLGIIMIVAGTLVMFELARFTGLGLMVYGLVQVFWGKGKDYSDDRRTSPSPPQ